MRIPGLCIAASIGAGLAFAPVTVAGCSSTAQDPGLAAGGDTAIQGHDANPYGVPYPSANIGFTPRHGASGKAGNVITNFKFLGYPNSDTSKGLQPVSLADYYDPEMRQYKVIHLSAAGVWCVWCQAEAKAVVPLTPELNAKKVVWVTTLAEGRVQGTPSTQADLDKWIFNYHTNFTHLLDPGNKNFGPFYDANALPWNANLDARTMEILSSGVGAPSTDGNVTADSINGEVDPWLKWVDEHPL